MLHQYLKNLLFNYKNVVLVTAFFSNLLFAQDGLVQSYKKTIEQKSKQFDEILSSSDDLGLSSIKEYQSFKLDKDFIQSILFYTPKRFLELGLKDKCSFYDLIISNIAKDKTGEIENFIVEILGNDNKRIKGKISRKSFIENFIAKECPESIEFAKYFTLENLKNTLKKFSFKVPKNKVECSQVRFEILADHKTPYFCYLNDEISKIKPLSNEITLTSTSNYKVLEVLKRKLNKSQNISSHFNLSAQNYLSNMCKNLDKEDNFCNYFFTDNFYKKVTSKEVSDIYVKNICMDIFKRYNADILSTCIEKISNESESCININDMSLFPKPNCKNLSTNLNRSSLFFKYLDCPASINNETIINISRLLQHFSNDDFKQSEDCEANTLTSYVTYNLKANGADYWNNKVCYDDKIRQEEVCYPTILKKSTSLDISLDENIKKILTKIRGISSNATCTIIKKASYNPILLKYKTGCYILESDLSCKENCHPQIIFDQEKIENIKFKQDFNFEYFASSYLTESKTQENLLVKNLKLKTRPISNTTILIEHFKNFPKTILHGTACIEALYPEYFKVQSMNQCSLVNFIIDGFIQKDGKVSLITRTSIDPIYGPKTLSWRRIFNGVRSFQKYHPLNKWSLNALYQ